MSKILIIGDVHGREFWKDACYNHKDEFDRIVFLGDYVSPYPYEKITNAEAIEVLKDILTFKLQNMEKVVLLLGNHDFSYINRDICESRIDNRNWNWLNEFFLENADLFDLAWETKVGDKRFFFSHAGVRKGWFDSWARNVLFAWDGDELPEAWMFNNAFHVAYVAENETVRDSLEMSLKVYSYYRGYDGEKDGSMVWADIREYAKDETLKNDYENVIFVCGHTQLEDKPIIRDWVMDLDCRKPFVLDTDTGKVEEYK